MDKYPDMDEMIEAAKEKQESGMSMVFGFGVGRMMPLPTDSKKTKKGIEAALEYIKKLDGFLGVSPVDVDKNILLFDTSNNAKGGRNLLKMQSVSVGQVVPVLVESKYLEEAADQ